MTLRIAIPCYGLSSVAEQALFQTVGRVRAATRAQVHVFYAPGQAPVLPEGISAHAQAPAPEPESALPRGWFTAATVLGGMFPDDDVLVVSPGNPNLPAGRVAQAASEMIRLRPAVLLSTTPSRDHPCQWEEYFDIVASQAFTPVDVEEGLIGVQAAQALGLSGSGLVSVCFTMPSLGPWPQQRGRGKLFEWLPDRGLLCDVSVRTPGPSLPMEQRVFFWHQAGPVVRQVSFCGQALAALPLFRPPSQAAACFLRQGALWRMGLAREAASAERYQVFPLPSEHNPRGISGAMDLHPVAFHQETLQVAGAAYLGTGAMSPLPGSPLFLFNALTPARLPNADISLPYHSAHGGWELDLRTMAPINCATRAPIAGRQHFPDVLELEGSLLGLSARVVGDPLSALMGAEPVQPFLLDEGELSPPGTAPAASPAILQCQQALLPEYAAGHIEAVRLGLRELRAEVDLARLALDAGKGDALSHLGKAMARLVEVRHAHVALVLEQETVARQIKEDDETCIDLLPLRIHLLQQGKTLQKIPENLEHGVLFPIVGTLLELWQRSRKPGAREGQAAALPPLEGMRAQAAALGLHPCWASGLPLGLAQQGLHQLALDMLRGQYAHTPWLQDEHARIAVHCFRPQCRFDEYLFWLEQDALPGRMSPPWLFHYCEALAVCRQEARAEQVVAEAYARHPSLANCRAVISWWRFVSRDFLPDKALPGFDKDAAEGRLNGVFVILHAAALAAAGKPELACEVVAQAYAKDMAAANGYSMVGWYYHLLLRREPDQAIALFERDASLGRLQASWKSCLAAAHAFKGDMARAEGIIAEVYAESPLHIGCMAQLGLTHWLSHGDLPVVLEYFRRDMDMGRLASIDLQLVYYAFLALSGQSGAERARGLLKGTPRTAMTWDLCVARLGLMGFREADVAGVMTPELRAGFLAVAPQNASAGACCKPEAAEPV